MSPAQRGAKEAKVQGSLAGFAASARYTCMLLPRSIMQMHAVRGRHGAAPLPRIQGKRLPNNSLRLPTLMTTFLLPFLQHNRVVIHCYLCDNHCEALDPASQTTQPHEHVSVS